MEMLKKLWCGEYSLVKTYWLFYVLLWNIVLLPLVLFRQLNQSTQDSYLILGLLFAVIFIAYGCGVLVGLWRSANKYRGWWLWANLAKVVVILGIVIVAVSIFGALQANLMCGGVLLLSVAATLTLIKFYGTDGYTKNIKIFLVSCLTLTALLVVLAAVGFNGNSISSSKNSNWLPLVKVVSFNKKDVGLSEGMAYLDFDSITSKNGFKYAYEASEIYQDGEFIRTVKLYDEFDCATPKFRTLTQTIYSKKISEGFGKKLEENLNFQEKIAKSTTDNGLVYTGGWDTYEKIEDRLSFFCGDGDLNSLTRAYKFQCLARKKDMAILKSVCEGK